MKKLLIFSYALFLGALSIVSANPAPLLAPLLWRQSQSMMLGLSDADLSTITSFAATNQLALVSQLVNGLDIAQDIMVYPNVKNKIPMPKLTIGNGFRPYGAGAQEFKVKNLSYTDRYLEVKVGKRELQIDPEDYMASYFAWVNSPGSSAAKKDIPFAQFMWEQVIKGVQREMNDETSYFGFDSSATPTYNAGSVYTGGTDIVKYTSTTNNPNNVVDYYKCITTTTAGQNPDNTPAKWLYVTARAVAPGLESYILTGISTSAIAPVATGAITATGGVAIAAFNKLFRAWSTAYRQNGIIISASQTDMDFLIDDILVTYSKYTRETLTNAPYIVLPNSNGKCRVKLATWLGSSRRLISGPDAGDPNGRHLNLYMGTDLLSDATQITVKDVELWKLNAGLKTRIGFQIQDMTAIKVGDQA